MLYIASDHGGFTLKKRLVRYFENELKITFKDLGPLAFEKEDDYPDFATAVAKQVSIDKDSRGILICTTGNGMCISANKLNGIRAILGYSIESVELGRQDNNANVLCLSGGTLTDDHAIAIVNKFLKTEFSKKDRHKRRLSKIAKLEKK